MLGGWVDLFGSTHVRAAAVVGLQQQGGCVVVHMVGGSTINMYGASLEDVERRIEASDLGCAAAERAEDLWGDDDQQR